MLDSDQETIDERISTADSEDLFIFFTKYGNSSRLKQAISDAKDKNAKVIVISGKSLDKKSNVKIDVIHYLFVDTEMERGLEANFSKSVPFHYFIDLLIYHYNNKYVK
jgi:DNA-binding MurR/RpiR family transcriptional regulator